MPITAIGIALRQPTQDNSYLWHVEAGLRQIDLGAVLTADPFTFTAAGEPWRTQSWLVELGYGWFERLGPLASADVIVGFSAVVLLASVGLRVAPGRRLLGPLAVVWVMWLSLGHFTARPVFFSLALFGLLTLIADREKLRWTIPLLFWVWASSHGGFVIGVGYLVLQALRTRRRSHLTDATVGLLVASLTAHGWAIWEILISFAGSSDNLDLIREWLPPDFVSLPYWPFLAAIVALITLGTLGQIQRNDLWVILPFLVFAFTANRAVSLAAVAIVPFVFAPTLSSLGTSPLARPAAWTAVALIFGLGWLVPVDDESFETKFPVLARSHLADVPTFHDDATGGYLIYEQFPYVFVDDRAELFGGLYRRFVDAVAARPGWEDLFEEHDVEQVLLRKEDTLVEVLRSEGWIATFEDDQFVVLVD